MVKRLHNLINLALSMYSLKGKYKIKVDNTQVMCLVCTTNNKLIAAGRVGTTNNPELRFSMQKEIVGNLINKALQREEEICQM